MKWLPIPHYEHYEISEYGDVRRIGEMNGVSRENPRPLVTFVMNNHYAAVSLSKKGQKQKLFLVHRLVALAFIGEPPTDGRKWVCHGDGNRMNNHISNLRYDTPKANAMDAMLHDAYSGRRKIGSKLNPAKVLEIRSSPMKTKELAEIYDVTKAHIWKVRNRHLWAHI